MLVAARSIETGQSGSSVMGYCSSDCSPRWLTGAEGQWSWNTRPGYRAHAHGFQSSRSGYMERSVYSVDPIDAQDGDLGVDRWTENEQRPADCRSRALAESGLDKDVVDSQIWQGSNCCSLFCWPLRWDLLAKTIHPPCQGLWQWCSK